MPRFANGKAFEAFVITNAAGDGYDLLYANHDTANVVRMPFPGTLTAQVEVEDGGSLAGASIGLWTLAWEDTEGQPSAGPAKMSAAALAAYVTRQNHDGVEIPDEMCARVRVTGLLAGYGVKVESSEHVDSFTLVPPDQMPVGGAIASRLAPLQANGAGNWRSQHKIIIYESSPDISRLTDEEWNALKDAGYLAVHNFSANAVMTSLVSGAAAGSMIVSAKETEHHIFQTWAHAKKAIGRAKHIRAMTFWKCLGIDPDKFTSKWNEATHVSSHNLKVDITGITKDWDDFIELHAGSTGFVPPHLANQVRGAAVIKAFDQIKTFKIPIYNMKVYQTPGSKPGSSLKEFMNMHAAAVGGTHSPQGRISFIKKYKDVIAEAGKAAGRKTSVGAFARNLGPLGAAELLIGAAVLFNDPAQALAERTGYPRETWVEIFRSWENGDNPDGEKPPAGVSAQVLPDGSVICIGMPWRIYDVEMIPTGGQMGGSVYVTKVPKIAHIIDATISAIRPSYLSGKGRAVDIQVEYKHPHTSLEYRHWIPGLICGGQPPDWYNHNIGETLAANPNYIFFGY